MRYLVLILVIVSSFRSNGATIAASSTSLTDVQAVVNASVTGDTVVVPPGTSTWITNLFISGKGIRLQGSGTNSTIIIDENPNNRDNQPSLIDIIWQNTNGPLFELTGFQFRGGVTNTATLITGMIRFKASNNMVNDSLFRIHDNLFNDPWGRPMLVRAWSGLIDKNTFYLTHHLAGLAFDNRIAAGEQGDRSWAVVVPSGTTNLLYFEHNQVLATGTPRAIIDAFAGARYVARYNYLQNRCIENHGTESTQRARSGRWFECYGNTFVQTGSSGERCVLFRGGGGIVFSNTVSGPWPGLCRIVYFLMLESHSPWGMANGTNVWDINYPGPFDTGTHSGAANSPTLVDNTKFWTPNQWCGYSVINYSQTYTNVTVQHMAGYIESNTTNSLTLTVPTPVIEQFTWQPGNQYKIWRVNKALDAPGRGSGLLLSGGSSSVSPTPIGFPNQPDEPIHFWANSGTTIAITTGCYPIVEGRDWTNSVLQGYVPLVDPHPLAGGVIVPQIPIYISFGQQPASTVQSNTIVPPVTVFVNDVNGNLVTGSSASVTVAIANNPSSGVLSGTKTKNASFGIATFNDLKIDKAGTNYTLSISSTGLAGTNSVGFNITSTVLTPSKLVVSQQPTDAYVSNNIIPPVSVRITDSSGTQTSVTNSVTVSIGTNPSGGSLTGTLTRSSTNGVSMFNDLKIDKSGVGYTLNFASSGLTGTNSVGFNINDLPSPPPPRPNPPTGLNRLKLLVLP